MKGIRFKYGIEAMCRILRISESSYYKWLHRKPSKRVREEGRLEVELKAAHQRIQEICGPETLQHELKEQGVKVGTVYVQMGENRHEHGGKRKVKAVICPKTEGWPCPVGTFLNDTG